MQTESLMESETWDIKTDIWLSWLHVISKNFKLIPKSLGTISFKTQIFHDSLLMSRWYDAVIATNIVLGKCEQYSTIWHTIKRGNIWSNWHLNGHQPWKINSYVVIPNDQTCAQAIALTTKSCNCAQNWICYKETSILSLVCHQLLKLTNLVSRGFHKELS